MASKSSDKVNIDTSEQKTVTLEQKSSGINFVAAVIFVIRWWSIERVIALSMLFTAFVLAFTPVVTGTIWHYLVTQTGISISVVSHWYLFSALYLFWKGPKISFFDLVICYIPLLLSTISSFILNSRVDGSYKLDFGDIAREIFVNGIIIQRMISKLTVEMLENFAEEKPPVAK